MYSHGQVWDTKPDEGEPRMIEVGNATETIARGAGRYFASKEAADASADRARAREQAEKDRIAQEKADAKAAKSTKKDEA